MTQKSSTLDAHGIGRQIAFDITLVESPTSASPASILDLLTTLFS